MNDRNTFITTAMAAAMALIGSACANAGAADKPKAEGDQPKQVACYGIAKAGKNDCGNSRHQCAGEATKDNMADEWVYVTGDCEKMGGSLRPIAEAPAKK